MVWCEGRTVREEVASGTIENIEMGDTTMPTTLEPEGDD